MGLHLPERHAGLDRGPWHARRAPGSTLPASLKLMCPGGCARRGRRGRGRCRSRPGRTNPLPPARGRCRGLLLCLSRRRSTGTSLRGHALGSPVLNLTSQTVGERRRLLRAQCATRKLPELLWHNLPTACFSPPREQDAKGIAVGLCPRRGLQAMSSRGP